VTPIATRTSWVIRYAFPAKLRNTAHANAISTTALSTPGVPTSTECVGTKYTIKSGDTCNSIALSQGLSTGELIDANKLQAFCANFPKSGTLCIPQTSKCKTRTVETDDTCAKIADANRLAWSQIVSWNPDFGKDCKRIGQYVGYVMCISTPGGDWINPDPQPVPTPTTTPYVIQPFSCTCFLHTKPY
jgi:hypothetical protein